MREGSGSIVPPTFAHAWVSPVHTQALRFIPFFSGRKSVVSDL
jgi:hypothetical protein